MELFQSKSRFCILCLSALCLSSSPRTTAFFCPPSTRLHRSRSLLQETDMGALNDNGLVKTALDDEIERWLERARMLLEKSKAKLARQGSKEVVTRNGAETNEMPFYATELSKSIKAKVTSREEIIKWKDEKTGAFTTDGEKMAALSESEEWELRSLRDVFENEISENEDVYSLASKQLAERDVATSIFYLRRMLQTEDYHRIFDRKNIFIGEDN